MLTEMVLSSDQDSSQQTPLPQKNSSGVLSLKLNKRVLKSSFFILCLQRHDKIFIFQLPNMQHYARNMQMTVTLDLLQHWIGFHHEAVKVTVFINAFNFLERENGSSSSSTCFNRAIN